MSFLLLLAPVLFQDPPLATLRGEVVDAADGRPLAARIHLRGADGVPHHVSSADAFGAAIPYAKQSFADPSVIESHTCVSAHPFAAVLPPGRYVLEVEHGKEWLPARVEVTLEPKGTQVRIPLRRFADLPSAGWYSGETHVHRSLEELPVLMEAEDLNVALPLAYWVRDAFQAPKGGPREPDARLIEVSPTRVIWPRNTEYEIFSVGPKRHTLGALFVLGHRSRLDLGVPPVDPVARKAREEGALLELDKHNWPWTMMLPPVAEVDLYELANNHVWRSGFAFRQFGEAPPAHWGVERDEKGMTERGWLEFGFRNYYALLDCGHRLRPTAGTASGVHPVPLGFGRVYVRLPGAFSYEEWMKALGRGNSFVSTGPLLRVLADGKDPGTSFGGAGPRRLVGTAESAVPLGSIEIVGDGGSLRTLKPANHPKKGGGFESPLDEVLELGESGWFAVRCWEERPDGRPRFAHTAPWHVVVEGLPLRPRRADVDYLVARMEAELERSGALLPGPAKEEYRKALEHYRARRDRAR